MTLSYPSGRVRDTAERAFLVLGLRHNACCGSWHPRCSPTSAAPGCAPHAPSLLFTGHVLDLTLGRKGVLGAHHRRWAWPSCCSSPDELHDSSPAARRTLVPLVLAGAFGALEFITLRAADLTDWTQAYNTLNWIDRTTLLVVPVAIFAGLGQNPA